MNAKKLMRGLTYLGNAEGKRQTYHVFKGSDFFLVLSFSRSKRGAGNFNVVGAPAVDYVHKRFAGKSGVTTGDVVNKARRSRHVPSALAALNMLYVLAAMGRAKVDARRGGPKLFFNVHRA
jgi:hypothetical protein